MSLRQPFPWEYDSIELVEEPVEVDPMRFLAVPELPEADDTEEGPTVTYVEAEAGTARRGMDGLERRLREHGYSPEFSREQAAAAARRIAGRNGIK
jgi:hypothetical protein